MNELKNSCAGNQCIGIRGSKVELWDGTQVDIPGSGSIGVSAEVGAICEDVEFLLNDKTMFAMRYDPGSFSKEVMIWLQSHFEPAVNCIAKHQLVTFEEDNEYLLMTVDKQHHQNMDDPDAVEESISEDDD